ncbi:hypothetical protein GCM10023331_03290 [Algivirga pacifica]|uniref:Uncharacterized protein n=1 Tax=Algivirga pacifica TaxID=1162670 RepID=A0ABP9CZR9_9BACT
MLFLLLTSDMVALIGSHDLLLTPFIKLEVPLNKETNPKTSIERVNALVISVVMRLSDSVQ